MDYYDFREMVKSAVRIPGQNFMGLKSSLDVDAVVNDIDEAIDKALQQGRGTEKVMDWIRQAEDPKFIFSVLKEEIENKGKRCWWCPNLKSHYQLSMEAGKHVQYVAELLKKIRVTQEEAHSTTEQKVAAAAVKDFMYFPSRGDVSEEIMVALQSPRISSIGVYGEAGVGKTMLVEEIKRKAEQLKLFDHVVMAKVTNNPDMRRIQDDIAHDLGLELPDRITCADRIKSSLTDRKVLVILDDIWARIDLEEVGIPFGNKHKQKLKQPIEKKNEEISSVQERTECIVLLTSRDSGVLSREMHAHKIIEVGRLKEEEARELFVMIAGEQAKRRIFQCTAKIDERRTGEQPIAEIDEIVEECNQLPIAVATLASTLEDKSLIQWRTTIKKLRLQRPCESDQVNNWSGMSPSLCSAIKLRYSELESEELKHTLFLCSLMKHNADIQDLLKYGIGLGLFPKADSIEEARDEALKLVKKLRRSPSLLLEGSSSMHFDMHDSIRDVAISIASEKHGVLALGKDADMDKFNKKAMEKFKWIYFSNGDASQLPYRLKCPQLTFFHLANKNTVMEIPDNFFRGTGGLRVLGLTKMSFSSSIPSSISLLINLHTLRLDQSELGTNIGSIMGNLKNLQVLSLRGCDLEELPQETKKLVKLKLLDMSDCTKLKVIPPDVLKSLSKLEELYLGNSFDQWEDSQEHENRSNASLDELTQLENLTNLELRIRDIQMIPDGLFSVELKRYKIFIGDMWNYWDSSFENSKTLKLERDGNISFDKVRKLLNKAEELHLEKLNGVKNVVDELDKNGFQELKCLHVKNDPDIQHILFNSVKQIHSEVFPKLEALFVNNLMKLEKIFRGQFEKTSFKKLKIITVARCNQLENLFSFSAAKQLLYLQEIRVTDCSNIVEIVDDEDQEEEEGTHDTTDEAADDVIELVAKIQCLRLQHLTDFISFSKEKIIRSRSTSLFEKKLVGGHKIWNLTKLIIERCDKLENLFPSSIVDCLEKLKHLEIRECKRMTEIIVTEETEEWLKLIRFDELNILQIEDLQNLIRFCSGNYRISFSSLKQLAINNCPELKGFLVDDSAGTDIDVLFDDKVYFPTLERMTISHLKNLELIWRSYQYSFGRLNFLHIKDLPNLIGLCQKYYGRKFSYLKQLTIENCPQLNGFSVESMRPALFDKKIAFPQLERITISYLNNVKIIWKKLTENSFGNLRSLRVTYFQNLSTIFPSNCDMLEKLLPSLEELEIIGCSSVEEVFELGQSEITRRAEEVEENKLIFQQLKLITIADCPNMIRFASTFSRDQEPFFSTKVEFSKLELLVVEDCHGFKNLMPFSMAQSFSQLKKLVIRSCKKMEEVIVTEEFAEENRIILFPKLDSMELEDLPELTRFSEPQTLPATTLFVFPKVTYLKFSKLPKLESFLPENATEWPELTSVHVCDCDQMQIFALEFPREDNQHESQTQHPLFWVSKGLEGQEGSSRSSTIELPAVCFVNLRTLEVSRCHGLITLLRYTVAKRLDQLSTVSITDCSKLKEIVACQDDEVKDGIVFNKLTYLELGLLSRLESFCSRECNFNFPSLQEVIVSECPKMNIFSKGVVKTEKLQKVKLTKEDDAGIWKDGDLNSSIQYLFINKNHLAAEPFKTRTLPHFDEFHRTNAEGANAINEGLEKEDGQEKEDNEDDGHDINEHKGENSVSLDDSHPSVAQDAQESDSERGEVASSSKEKKRGEDSAIVGQDAQEPDSKRAEGEPTAECIVNAARLLGNDIIREVNNELFKSIGSDVTLLEKFSKLDSALSTIEGLTEDERDIALRKLPDHPIQILIFFSLSPDRRLAWVKGFLMDH